MSFFSEKLRVTPKSQDGHVPVPCGIAGVLFDALHTQTVNLEVIQGRFICGLDMDHVVEMSQSTGLQRLSQSFRICATFQEQLVI